MSYIKSNSESGGGGGDGGGDSPNQDEQMLLTTTSSSWTTATTRTAMRPQLSRPLYNSNVIDDDASSPGIYYTNLKYSDTNNDPFSKGLKSGPKIESFRKMRKRVIAKNGEYNVIQRRISQRHIKFIQDLFTTLVDTRWRWTLLAFTLSFILSWLGFAVIWWIISFTHGDFQEMHLPQNQAISGFRPCVYNSHNFASLFLFSIETQHTIGYGYRATSEACPEGIFLMCFQCIFGVFIQAFMVGIVFAKMTRPRHRTQTLMFSKNAVIAKRNGELLLMFRVGDIRSKTHIIGGSVQAIFIQTKCTDEGEILPQYQIELNIETDGCTSNLFLVWPMIMTHRIGPQSPLYRLSANDLLQDKFEIVVMLQGTVESTGQSIQARSSYLNMEILWGYRFQSCISYSRERQEFEIDYGKFNAITKINDTPICSAHDLLSSPSDDNIYGIANNFNSSTEKIINQQNEQEDILSNCKQ